MSKKRVELQIDREKDSDVVYFLENQVDNQAGFIKNLLRDYVRFKNGTNPIIQKQQENKVQENHSPEPKKESKPELAFLQQNAITSDDFD